MVSTFLPVLVTYHHALFYTLTCKYDNIRNMVMLKILYTLLMHNLKDFLVSEILTVSVCKSKQNIKVVNINKGLYVLYYDCNVEAII
jgi:hypothetical protein